MPDQIATWRRQRKTILDVIRWQWKLTLIGFALGIFFVGISALLVRFGPEFLGSLIIWEIIKEVGVGFLVAAIAVFAYEWSDSKEVEELSEELTETLNKQGLDALKKNLEVLLGKEDDSK